MSETNGHGEESRLDRVESLLEKLATSHYLQDERIAEHEARHEKWSEDFDAKLDAIATRFDEQDKALRERIETLVSAIGTFITKLGEASLG